MVVTRSNSIYYTFLILPFNPVKFSKSLIIKDNQTRGYSHCYTPLIFTNCSQIILKGYLRIMTAVRSLFLIMPRIVHVSVFTASQEKKMPASPGGYVSQATVMVRKNCFFCQTQTQNRKRVPCEVGKGATSVFP